MAILRSEPELNEIAKRAISDRLIRAISKEKMTNQQVADLFEVKSAYLSMIKNSKHWGKCPISVWKKFQAWTNSGESIERYCKKGKEMKDVQFDGSSSVAEAQGHDEDAPKKKDVLEIHTQIEKDNEKKKSGVVPGNPGGREKEKKPYEPPKATKVEVGGFEALTQEEKENQEKFEKALQKTLRDVASQVLIKRRITIAVTILMGWFLVWLIVSVHTINDDIHFTGKMLLDGFLVVAFGFFWIWIRTWIVKTKWRLV